ncbi:MAG: DM13 domain-containing protein [Hellea sp.]
MTTKSLIKDILITTTGVSAFTLIALAPVLAYASDTAPKAQEAAVQVVDARAELSGSFEGRTKHVTSGEVSIIKTDAGYELILGDNFFLDGAPDPVIGFGNNGKYDKATTFTKLEKKTGRQTYALPEGFTLSNYSQVFVWCEKFAVPLGVATLS